MSHIYRLSIVVVASIIVVACGQIWPRDVAVDEATVVVQRGSLRQTVSATGTIQPVRSADLFFGVDGTVDDVLIEEGEYVRQGQALASLNTTVLEAQAAAARAQRDAAQAQIDRIDVAANNDGDDTGQTGTPGSTADTSEAAKLLAQAQLRQAEAQLRQAELKLQNATLHAPFSGIVTAINVAPGDSSTAPGAAGSAAISVADTSRFYVEATINEYDIVPVQQGQTAEITIEARAREPIEGTVSYVAPAATMTQNVASYRVHIELPTDTDDLRIGMTGSVDIIIDQRHNVLLVPTSAIYAEADRHMVRLKRDAGFSDIMVRTGISNDTYTEIVSGLNAGDEIAINGGAAGTHRATRSTTSRQPTPTIPRAASPAETDTATLAPTAGPFSPFIADTFDSPTSGWPVRDEPTWSAGYADGRYQLTLNGRQTTGVSIPLPDTDYRLDVEVILSDGGDAGLIVAFEQPATFYQLGLRSNGSYAIQRLEHDTLTNVEAWTASPALEQGAGAVNRIRIERHTDAIRFFANGQELAEFTPPTQEWTNRFGVTLTSANERGLAHFDNLEVETVSQ